jgi:hypothetical protein
MTSTEHDLNKFSPPTLFHSGDSDNELVHPKPTTTSDDRI